LQEGEKLNITKSDLPDVRVTVDMAIRDLTQITFPTTIDTLSFQNSDDGLKVMRSFRRNLTSIAILALLIAVFAFSISKAGQIDIKGVVIPLKDLGMALLGVSLGLLGAITYVIFNLIGEWTEKVMNKDDPDEAYLRLLLGPLLGWVFFFAFCQGAFGETGDGNAILLLPFLAGFSTKLVVGVFNQAIQAVQITLGLEDKGSHLLARKARSKDS